MAGHTSLVRPSLAPAAPARRWSSTAFSAAPGLRDWPVLVSGVLGAGLVGYLTAHNPQAAPAELAIPLRMVVIGAYVAAALVARHRLPGSRMAYLLSLAVPLAALWLLNGAAVPLAFSIGLLCGGLVPVGVAYLMLAHPLGHLHCDAERRFLALSGGLTGTLWLLAVELSGRPPLRTPLIGCGVHCPSVVTAVGQLPTAPAALTLPLGAAWLTMTVGTAALLHRRHRAASASLRRSLTPVAAAAGAAALLSIALTVLYLSPGALPSAASARILRGTGLLYASGALLVPLAVLLGLSMERLSMARTLARLVRQLAISPDEDPRLLIARSLADPTLEIAYLRPESGAYVDGSGAPVALPVEAEDRAISWIRRQGRPVAAVIHDRQLSDQEGFIEAVGAAALSRLERAQLEAELRASSAELARSRIRVLESADAERRRLERDLHDGVQQDLIGLRIKLGLAVDALHDDPRACERQLEAVSGRMDEVLRMLRDFARGIYPAVLRERGLADALRSAAASSPNQVSVRASGLARYPQDIEVAVYFCCMEALQNVAKHSGPAVPVTLSLFERSGRVHFQVRDFGPGFEPGAAMRGGGSGLTNMQDRIETLGGRLSVTSAPGRGTVVRGSVPVEEVWAGPVPASPGALTPFG